MKIFTSLILTLFFTNISLSQVPNYKKLWSEVETLELKDLPKSALEKVEHIDKIALQADNQPQHIKAMLYKSKFALVLQEDAQLEIIDNFKSEIAKSEAPSKNILESMLANFYWDYFKQHRYQFYNRTKTAEKVDETDFRTWDLNTLFAEIQLHFQHSLTDETILKNTAIDTFSDLILEQKNSKLYRPTIFDLLSHNALEFYKSNERNITKPAYTFTIDNPKLASPAQTFLDLNLETKDTTSLEFQALKIYQDLICYHLTENNIDALVTIDIERLLFVKAHAVFEHADDLSIETLKKSEALYRDHSISGFYNLEIAKIWKTQGESYAANTLPETQWKLKDAVSLCESVISKFPKSNAAAYSEALKLEIQHPEVSITNELILPNNSKSRFLITYKNLENLDFKAAKISRRAYLYFNNLFSQKDKDSFANTLNFKTAWTAKLKNEGDFQEHRTEIIVPELDNGIYLITATDPLSKSKTYNTLQVSDIAIVKKDNPEQLTFQCINRTTGKPFTNTKVTILYTHNRSKNKTETKTTDAYGNFSIPKTNEYVNFDLTIHTPNDTVHYDDFYLGRNYNRNEDKNTTNYKSFVFTDRSIYRPGQTLYFKAIAMQTQSGDNHVLKDETLQATLYNSNYEEVQQLSLKTNTYGSIHGSFILPSSGLNGQYNIEIKAKSESKSMLSRTYVSVEDYKRPTFEAYFSPITDTYTVNDSVKVSGEALAFTGSKITNAKVVYRVTRTADVPYWYYRSMPHYNSESLEITHGETLTDDAGQFTINFKAIPDLGLDKAFLPVFNYRITADITDINGETHSESTTVSVGYHTVKAQLTIDRKLDKTSKNNVVNVSTTNLNGAFAPIIGTLKIYKFIAPNHVLRPRPWAVPDYKTIDEATFKSLFPFDTYQDEDRTELSKKGEPVFEKIINTENTKTLNLEHTKHWESGKYIAVFESKDNLNQDITDQTTFELFSIKDKTVSDHGLFEINTNKTEYKPGESVELNLGSAAKDIVVTVEIEKDHKVYAQHIINLSANKETIKIPVLPSDLGGFAIHYSYAAFNSFSSGTLNISVPYPPTDLQIETETFRDKIQPGSEETWRFKISGPQGEKVTAEVLASMYDASLDQFKSHDWSLNANALPTYYAYNNWRANTAFGTNNTYLYINVPHKNITPQGYDAINWFGFSFNGNSWVNRQYLNRKRSSMKNPSPPAAPEIIEVVEDQEEAEEIVMEDTDVAFYKIRGNASVDKDSIAPLYIIDGVVSQTNMLSKEDILSLEVLKGSEATALYGVKGANGVIIITTKNGSTFNDVKIRKNLKETAFFFPQLQTNSDGEVSFSFRSPEALTQWKLQLLAHTPSVQTGQSTLTTVTQKELMVQPNAPRFLRQGDEITISSKIVNLSENLLEGQAVLQLFDAVTNAPIDINLDNIKAIKPFTVHANNNTQVSWTLKIPETVDAVLYKILAKTEKFSDGEQNILPVLSNRMLVTESLPMWVNGNTSRTFQLDKLKYNSSKTLKHHKLTLEITSNPAWYALQALPYVMEYPYDCNEQVFSRFYANSLGSQIVHSNPRIQEVFNLWKSKDALISNLEKNDELKSILIEETPWLRDAQSETEQKKRIGLLFDLNTMTNSLETAKQKLERNQLNSGGWPWFAGGRENRYITQHILTGFGHLEHLGVNTDANAKMLRKALQFSDKAFIKTYRDISKYNATPDYDANHLTSMQLHYLYMRSFYTEDKPSEELQNIINYYKSQIQTFWTKKSLYDKGLMALIMHRSGDKKTATAIIKSLQENSITSEELGMYWKANTASWYWNAAPIETQSLLIEAFSEIENDTKTIDNLTKWLLKNKQTNRWSTTKSTTDAVYAILLQGSDWISVSDAVNVTIGGESIPESKLKNNTVEAGTGYFKTTWNADEITPELAEVTLKKNTTGTAWGSLYWQYFENLDAITSAETPLQLTKKLFLKSNTDTGEALKAIEPSTKLKVGDLITVRITLKTDRNMEFLHMKDMRASGLEPVNVLSSYKWQDGLGYYESTKDAATHFFFDSVSKGIYVFEYDLRVNNAGKMSNGITTIESMYAPEFNSHSEGTTITIK